MMPERTIIPDADLCDSKGATFAAYRTMERVLEDHGGEWNRDESIPGYVWKPVPTLAEKPEGGA